MRPGRARALRQFTLRT
ncbi:BnaC09g14130D [Brassica napus]|uniref:BnaC09g14130D protein n=3 Tax=Brassica napus TaxID=3708 RepID=A0A078IAX1_BRANA|nr:BnaC09g14130D [Brassica napus]